MWNKRQAGVTLVELIIAMVIISVGVIGVIQVFAFNSVASADPMVTKQMRAVAEGLMEEIQHQPLAASANVAPSGCARNTYNDIADYNGYAKSVICDINGMDLGLTSMTVSVTVGAPAAAATLFPGVAAGSVLEITVIVTYAGQSFTLKGWRTTFA